MKLLQKFSIALAILLVSTSGLKAQTPIAICPDQAQFSGMTRGYHFTAPVDFVICGLYVEDDRSTGAQSVEIVRFGPSGAPPAYAATTNDFTSLFYQANYVPNSMISVPNVVINAGDVIGIYGSRGNAVNSYGQAQCATTIQGFPVTLYRSGMQANLAVGQMANIWSEVNYYIGRVTMYTGCCLPPVMSMIPETCAGSCDGTATATPDPAGVPPFTYQWDAAAGNQTTQTATGLCAGTYSVNVTDGNGCVVTASITVTSGPAAANATITPAGPFCELDPPQNLTAVDPGGTWSGAGITDPVNGTFDPGTAGVGTHTITYSIAGPCGDTQTTTITVNPNQDATITPAGPFCTIDPALNLNAVDPGGTWSGNGITDPVNGTFDPATAGAGVHTITYTIAGPCGDVQTTNITVNNQMNATITPAGPFCELDPPTNLTAVDAGGTWSGTGITDAVNGTFDPSVAGVGTHTITYEIVGNCGDIQTSTITVNPNMDATITPVGPFCTAEPAINLNAVDPGGAWSGNGITDPVNGTFDPATAGVGTHTITYTIAGQCGDVQTLDITINPTFSAVITPAGPFCELEPAVNLNAVDPGGSWSGTGITDAVNGTFDPGVAGAGSFTITYEIPGVCGDLQTTVIDVNPALDATITPVGPFCASDPSLNLNAVDPGGSWSGNGITDPVNGTFDPATAGIGTHTITYSIPGTCGDTETIDIIINDQLDATIAPAGPYCEFDPAVTLVGADPGGTWSGNGIIDPVNGVFDPMTAGPGTHTITYSIPGSCGDTQFRDILVNPSEDATITPAGPFCLGTSTTLSAVTAGGTWSGTGITDPANGTFDATVAGSGTHTITYTTNGPCPDAATYDITVFEPLSLEAFADTAFCEGGTAYLSATASGGDGNLYFEWTEQGGAVVGNGANISPSPTNTTVYTVTVTDGCTTPANSESILVTVYPIPSADFVVDYSEGCAPLEVTFTSSAGGNTNCNWDFGDAGASNDCGTVIATFSSPGCEDVTLTVEENGCINSSTMNNAVCVAYPPVADFMANPVEASELDPEVAFTNYSTNANTYFWDFGDISNNSTSAEVHPTHLYSNDPAGYQVCLIAYNEYCSDTTCKPVTIYEELLYYIPNTFTPDGDQFNQYFMPVFESGFDPFDFTLLIFNRWGEVVWESHDASVGWDGTFNGEPVIDGTYVWKIEFKTAMNDKRIIDTGHVNIMR